MLKGKWGAERNGTLPHVSIPGKTTTLVPEVAVENLLRQKCSLGPCACILGPALGQSTLMMMMMVYNVSVRKFQLQTSRVCRGD